MSLANFHRRSFSHTFAGSPYQNADLRLQIAD